MKKLEGRIAEEMKKILYDGDTIVEIDGKEYYLSLIEKPTTTVTEDIEKSPELKQKLLQAKENIVNGKTYSTQNVVEMIDQGEL